MIDFNLDIVFNRFKTTLSLRMPPLGGTRTLRFWEKLIGLSIDNYSPRSYKSEKTFSRVNECVANPMSYV